MTKLALKTLLRQFGITHWFKCEYTYLHSRKIQYVFDPDYEAIQIRKVKPFRQVAKRINNVIKRAE